MAKSRYKNNVSPYLRQARAQLNKLKKNRTPLNIKIDATASPEAKKIEGLAGRLAESIQDAHYKAVKLTADDLYLALGIAMESKVWDWDFGDGDIVDTGALRDSLTISVAGGTIEISYDQEYAAIVYFGGYIHPYGNPNVQIYMPARPWIEAVFTGANGIPRFDLTGVYERNLLRLLEAELS